MIQQKLTKTKTEMIFITKISLLYKAVMICATLVNTHTHTHTHKHRERDNF